MYIYMYIYIYIYIYMNSMYDMSETALTKPYFCVIFPKNINARKLLAKIWSFFNIMHCFTILVRFVYGVLKNLKLLNFVGI